MQHTIGATKHELPKSEADRLRLRTLGKLWSKPRVRLFLDHLVDMGPQGYEALLHRECGKSRTGAYLTAYTRYKLTHVGCVVLSRYRARASCDTMGSSSASDDLSTKLLAMMPPPLFVLEWEEMHGADVCRDDGGEGEDEARTSRALSPVSPSLCGTLAV